MALQLDRVVPWGRSLADYREMFALRDADLQANIIDCASGPSSFNAELTAMTAMTGNCGRVTSCDPVYEFDAGQIRGRIDATLPVIVETLEKTREKFVWGAIATPQDLAEVRLAAMEKFLADFPEGLKAQRYRTDALPELSFADRQFDLALSAHLLFTYSAQFDTEFHIAATLEMLRVAREVRIFPLLTNFTNEISPHLQPVLDALTERGFAPTIERVPYEFQIGGNEMLRVIAA
ncbi:MAG: SAM-dependent methyltransferase [Geitlerinemataceae cyanobacterium]